MIVEAMMGHEDPDKALQNLSFWFTHKQDHNISSYVDRVKRMRGYYADFKRLYESSATAAKCDHFVEAAHLGLLYYNMFMGVEEMTANFSGCYLYVLRRMQEFEKEILFIIGASFPKVKRFLYHGDHSMCKNCYLEDKRLFHAGQLGSGRNNYTGKRTIFLFQNLLQDAAHSKQIFGHGARDRMDWIAAALGVRGAMRAGGGDSGGLAGEALGEFRRQFVFDEKNLLGAGVTGQFADTSLSGLIAEGSNPLESMGMMGENAGWGQSFQSLFGTSGENAAQAGVNIFGVASVALGAMAEVGNSYLNRWQLANNATLGQRSIKHAAGIERLEILRANLKNGLLGDFVETYMKLRQAHDQCKLSVNKPIMTCDDGYALMRDILLQRNATMQLLGPQQYTQEFYNGVVLKLMRMTIRWMIMMNNLVNRMDVFYSGRTHSSGDCGGLFCHKTVDDNRKVGAVCANKLFDQNAVLDDWRNEAPFTLAQAQEFLKTFKHTEKWDKELSFMEL